MMAMSLTRSQFLNGVSEEQVAMPVLDSTTSLSQYGAREIQDNGADEGEPDAVYERETVSSDSGDSMIESVDLNTGDLPTDIAQLWEPVFMPTLLGRYSISENTKFPASVDDMVQLVRVSLFDTYSEELFAKYIETIAPGDVIYELSLQELHKYRSRFINTAISVVRRFFTAGYRDWDGRLKYCFNTPHSISSYVRSIMPPSGVDGIFHWAYYYSPHSCQGAYENPMLLEILGKAHLRQVEGANTTNFPHQEPHLALVLSLVALRFAHELWGEGTYATDSVIARLDCWDWDAIAEEHSEAFRVRQIAGVRYRGIPMAEKWTKIISGARKFV